MKRSFKNLFMIVAILVTSFASSMNVAPAEALGAMVPVPGLPGLPTAPGQTSPLQQGYLRGVWGFDPNNIFAVGYGNNGTGNPAKPVIYQTANGTDWTSSSPVLPAGFGGDWSTGVFEAVWGVDADHAFAVGRGGVSEPTLPLMSRWVGGNWVAESPALPTTQWDSGVLYGVWGTSSSNVWAVGYGGSSTMGFTDMPLVFHWTGSSWNSMELGRPSGINHAYLMDIWGTSATDIYVAGRGLNAASNNVPLLYHYNGSGWSEVPNLTLPSGWAWGKLEAIWGSGTSDIYAVGTGNNGTKNSPLIYHFNGTSWSSSTPSLPTTSWNWGELYGVWGSGTDVYAVGFGYNNQPGMQLTAPLLYRKTSTGWAASSYPPSGLASGHYQGIWGSAANNVYTVGYGHDGGQDKDQPLIARAQADGVSPGAVVSLVAAPGTLTGSVILTWTAPADDGPNPPNPNAGPVNSYIVQYSQSDNLTSCEDPDGTPVPSGSLPVPVTPGNVQTMAVTGLTPSVTYYFTVCARDEENRLSAFVPAVSAMAQISGGEAGIFDDRHAGWSFTGAWAQANTSGPYQNTFTYTSTVGDSATFTFVGTKISLYYLQHTNRGTAKIYIDNMTTPVVTLNMNGSLTWQKTWSSDVLAWGVHTVKIEHAGPAGTYVDVDAIRVYGPSPAGKYDDRDTGWTYTGTWTPTSSSTAYLTTFTYSSTVGNSASFTFLGQKIILSYLQYTNRGTANIYIDNFTTPVKVLNMNGPLVWQQSWTSDPLTPGAHTVKIVHAGPAGMYVDIDALQIIGTPDTTPPSAINPLNAATGSVNGTVNLSWTAVGDDGTSGTASSYLVRYSTSAITDETAWTNATPVTSGIPTPKASGQPESMVVSGLVPGLTYFFSVRAQDEETNLGGLSNSPSAAAKSPPPKPAGKYDDRDAGWTYTGSWTPATATGPYLGTFTYSSTVGNSAMFTFEGTKIILSYLQYTNRGTANIYIDNFTTPVKVLNMNGPLVWQQTWTSDPLTQGVHTMKIVHVSGTYMDVDALQVIGAPDTNPPGVINPLNAATGSVNGTVNLSWTSVGDDGTSGTATSYLVRYSTSAINDETAWTNATPVTTGIPTPKASGQPESMVVSGLVPGLTYFFSVRAQDEEPNLGGLSNSPSAVAKSPSPKPVGKYDDRDTGWTYTGTWTPTSSSTAYLTTFTYSSTVGNSASFTFSGQKIILSYLQYTNRGTANIYIDNFTTPVKVLNMNGPLVWQKTWTSDVLPAGTHTVKIVHASGTYVDVDAIEVAVPLDLTPPSAINPLNAATGTAGGTVNLGWTAVGDDGNTGTASAYQVRYSTSAINDETAWTNATPVTTGIPTPKASGQPESMVVSGLVPGQTYFFSVRAQDEEPNLGGLSNSPSAAAQTPTPVGTGIYDDRHAGWIYAGSWTQMSSSSAYQSTFTYSATAGNSAMFTFTGTKLTLYYLQYTNRGTANIYIDNFTTPVKVLNMNGALVWQKTWSSETLTPGVHTVKVEHVTGQYMDVDAIRIYGPSPAGKYDDRDAGWSYAGTSWAPISSSSAYQSTFTYSSTAGDSASFAFEGTQVTLYYLQYTNRGTANIYIDNMTTPVAVLNMNGPMVWQQSWVSAPLTPGAHILKIVHAGPAGMYVDIDAVLIQ